MTYRTGQHGQLFIKNSSFTNGNNMQEMAFVRDWNINFVQDTIETTALRDFDKTFYKGLRSFTGGGTLLYYDIEGNTPSMFDIFTTNLLSTTDNSAIGPNQKDLGYSANDGPDYVRLKLRLGSKNETDNENLEFFALITGFQITCSVGEVVTGQFSFTGTGPLLANDF